ncbi:hypothetical protein V8C86DRAFT_581650 [Haematococcus lacustris]
MLQVHELSPSQLRAMACQGRTRLCLRGRRQLQLALSLLAILACIYSPCTGQHATVLLPAAPTAAIASGRQHQWSSTASRGEDKNSNNSLLFSRHRMVLQAPSSQGRISPPPVARSLRVRPPPPPPPPPMFFPTYDMPPNHPPPPFASPSPTPPPPASRTPPAPTPWVAPPKPSATLPPSSRPPSRRPAPPPPPPFHPPTYTSSAAPSFPARQPLSSSPAPPCPPPSTFSQSS